MPQLPELENTIVAISSATGQGGIGIVRLSGKAALSIADKIVKTKKGLKPSDFEHSKVHYGWIVKEGHIVDEVLITVMREPKSYTRENIVEISSHGGTVILKTILTLAMQKGARLAQPGEFTKRAFLNGRIDLVQAEAVLDIIQSKTEAFIRVSVNQLKGELSEELERIREKLMGIYIEIEAIVNFPEDDIDTKGRQGLADKIAMVTTRVEKLLASSEQGKILKEGIKIVICGKPNAGKSSLLNILLREPRAIVSDIAGTTRDTIEESAQIKGIPLLLVDTAGILEPRDVIEEEAIRRSHLSIRSADLTLFVIDLTQPLSLEDKQFVNILKDQNVIIVLNKCDLKAGISRKDVGKLLPDCKMIAVSAVYKKGIEDLEDAIIENVWHGKVKDVPAVLLSNLRHIEAFGECRDNLKEAHKMIDNVSLEFVSENIKRAVHYLDNITGRNIDADLLDNIFSRFCIGK